MKKDKYFVMRERSSFLTPCYWNAIYQTSLKTKKIYGVALNLQWQYYKNGKIIQICRQMDWDKKTQYVSKKLSQKNYFEKIERQVIEKKKKIEEFLIFFKKINLQELNFKKLIFLVNKIEKTCIAYDSASVLAWFMGSDIFQAKLFDDLTISQEDFNIIITPEEKTAVSQLEEKISVYSKEIKENKRNLNKTAEELANNYGWIPFGYDGPEYWDKNYFLKELSQKNEITEKINEKASRKEILSKLTIKQRELIKRANMLATWTDQRKKYTFQLFYCYSKILRELERRYGISYKNLKFLFTNELNKLEKNKSKLLELSNQRINNGIMIKARTGIVKIISNKEKQNLLEIIENQNKISEIKGIVACQGSKKIYQGIAKIILHPKQADKINEGDFLIATMTSPDYILAMEKSAGFITDEGGITCHAAIIAREMRKPCIIGTKIATKVLKDGDLVEVDAERGVVRILEKKNKIEK